MGNNEVPVVDTMPCIIAGPEHRSAIEVGSDIALNMPFGVASVAGLYVTGIGIAAKGTEGFALDLGLFTGNENVDVLWCNHRVGEGLRVNARRGRACAGAYARPQGARRATH